MSIPIVISFNDNFIIPAGVCITSMLENAHPETKYDIYVLHDDSRLSLKNRNIFSQLTSQYNNVSIKFIDVNNSFKGAYEVRNVSIESYYRLLIPKLFSELDKLIYLDVDTIINNDLTDLYSINIDNYPIAGVPEFYSSVEFTQGYYIKSLRLSPHHYINAGILLFNIKRIRQQKNFNDLTITKLTKLKLLYQDQDIINILFKDNIIYLEHTYNYTYSKLKAGLIIPKPTIIHYTLDKPWKCVRPFGDIWWHYYKISIFYRHSIYYTYQLNAFENIEAHIKAGNILEKIGLYSLLPLKHFFFAAFKSLHIKLRTLK